MILIFGGAYQGKLDYAKKNFDIKTVCDCSDGAVPDFAADAIYGIEGFVKRQSPESGLPHWKRRTGFSRDVKPGRIKFSS